MNEETHMKVYRLAQRVAGKYMKRGYIAGMTVQDLAHELYLHAIPLIDDHDPSAGDVLQWARRLMHIKYVEIIRKKVKETDLSTTTDVGGDTSHDDPTHCPRPLDDMIAAENREQLRQFIADMPQGRRRRVMEAYLAGSRVKLDIAVAEGISHQAVSRIIFLVAADAKKRYE